MAQREKSGSGLSPFSHVRCWWEGRNWFWCTPILMLPFCPGCSLSCSLGQVPAIGGAPRRCHQLGQPGTPARSCLQHTAQGTQGLSKLLWGYTTCRIEPQQSLTLQNWALTHVRANGNICISFLRTAVDKSVTGTKSLNWMVLLGIWSINNQQMSTEEDTKEDTFQG